MFFVADLELPEGNDFGGTKKKSDSEGKLPKSNPEDLS